MAAHVLHALSGAGIRQAVAVIPPGERGAIVREALASDSGNVDLRFAVQDEPRGTADAVLAAREQVATSHVFVVNGDLALITAGQVEQLLTQSDGNTALATAEVDDPAKMGRICRDPGGHYRKIIEWKDATVDERRIREVNLGFYLIDAELLWPELERLLVEAGDSGEAYATDLLHREVGRKPTCAIKIALPDGRLNVETPSDAADAEAVLRPRIISDHLRADVLIRDRNAVWIDAQVLVEAGAVIEPGSHIKGKTTIAAGSRIGPNAIIEDSTIGRECILESCTIRASELRDHVEVGPYSTLRPGCLIESHAHIGTHAELKQARIGEHVQIGHFSYVGDAEVGARTNIGAGAITCNYDGRTKHRTIIGEDAFIGSDTMLVAPVVIGNRARTGAGSVVTRDIPDDGNAVGSPARLTPPNRSRQAPEPES